MGGGNVSQDQTSIICIDLKSFYASVECVERGLDPFKANLVVADPTRSKSTICLAITPAMKSLGIKNRCRIHEIPDCVKYITAMPRMQLYMDYSAKIYGIYLRYVSKEDIHVYSVDECFIDVTNYLQLYHLTAKEMAVKLMQEVMEETGITATAGVGTNLYLAKIAMDIVAKHVDDHIGILDEFSYREQLWDHKPLSDFWRIGSRTEKKLAGYGIHTMGDIAMASLRSEDWLYKMFGIDAELLIDHAWTSGKEAHVIRELTVGKEYTLVETKPADGYVTAESVKFTIKDTADVQKVEMKDDVTKVKISKQDIAGKELPGAKLTILDQDGKVVESWTSTEKAHYIEMLPIGKYTLREETAPDGYLVAKDVEFEVKDTGEVQHVTMVDEEKPAEKTPEGGKPVSDSPKTGDNTNLWLWFMLLGIGATGTGALAFMRKKKH